MALTHVFAGIPVGDRDTALAWYERLTGRPPDLIPNDSEAAWQLTATGWICVMADAGQVGTALHTVLVDDLDDFLLGAADRGIPVGPVETLGERVRFAMLVDPDGNRLKVGQA